MWRLRRGVTSNIRSAPPHGDLTGRADADRPEDEPKRPPGRRPTPAAAALFQRSSLTIRPSERAAMTPDAAAPPGGNTASVKAPSAMRAGAPPSVSSSRPSVVAKSNRPPCPAVTETIRGGAGSARRSGAAGSSRQRRVHSTPSAVTAVTVNHPGGGAALSFGFNLDHRCSPKRPAGIGSNTKARSTKANLASQYLRGEKPPAATGKAHTTSVLSLREIISSIGRGGRKR